MNRRSNIRKRLLIAALSLVIVWPLLAWAGAKWLIVNRQIDSPDAIVILSGPGTYIDGANGQPGSIVNGELWLSSVTKDC